VKAAHVIRYGKGKSGILFLGMFLAAVCAFGEGRGTAAIATPAMKSRRSWFERNFKRYSMEEVIAASSSPEDIASYVSSQISYRSDYGDEWAPAAETWSRGRGDCEDFAVVMQDMCGRIGVEVHVYMFFPAGRREAGHAVAVGQWQGHYWVSSNGSYQEADSFEGIRNLVAREMRWTSEHLWYSVLDTDGSRRFINRDRALAAAF